MDNIIEKIKKLLELSGNNPSECEAISAALKAQELMAKYDLTIEQIKDNANQREIIEAIYMNTGKHEMKTWKYGLADTISKNFKCKIFLYNKDSIVFYGYKEDAKIALQVFTYLYETGNQLAVKYYNKCRKEGKQTKGVMNSYLLGFRKGVASVLEEQCKALMIVTPKEVIDKFEERTKGFGSTTKSMRASGSGVAFDTGKRDGVDAVKARQISA